MEFAVAIVEKLMGREAAREVAEGLLFVWVNPERRCRSGARQRRRRRRRTWQGRLAGYGWRWIAACPCQWSDRVGSRGRRLRCAASDQWCLECNKVACFASSF
jgi:hypothetical protein